MNKRKVAVGPGASSLILIAVVLALCVLTVLTMISARNDEALAARSAETRQEVYGLFAGAERSLAKLDAALVSCLRENPADLDSCLAALAEKLPEGMKLKGDRVSWTEKAEERSLDCAVRILEPGSEKRTAWTRHVLTAGEIWEDEGFEFDDEESGDEESGEEESADEGSADEESGDEGSEGEKNGDQGSGEEIIE